jgi:hypothetical protein
MTVRSETPRSRGGRERVARPRPPVRATKYRTRDHGLCSASLTPPAAGLNLDTAQTLAGQTPSRSAPARQTSGRAPRSRALRLLLRRKHARPRTARFSTWTVSDMSADWGRPEAAARRSARREQPSPDFGTMSFHSVTTSAEHAASENARQCRCRHRARRCRVRPLLA